MLPRQDVPQTEQNGIVGLVPGGILKMLRAHIRNGKVELDDVAVLPEGLELRVLIGHEVVGNGSFVVEDEEETFQDLRRAQSLTTGFWDNALDDETWNED
jgi:hypothetical protein